MDVRHTASRLGQFVDEVIARTKLLKHYAQADELQVDLVGHSMGGLVITEYLAQRVRRSRVGKVATIGTPYLGSIEAIVKMTTGMSLITGPEPREREREAARVTPALYQLFPSYAGAVADQAGRDIDIFDCRNMQKSIVDSLAEFVRIYSVSTPASTRRARAVEILEEMLAGARRHRRVVDTFRPADAGLRRDDWLAIIGVGERTRINMVVGGRPAARRFTINEDQRINKLDSRYPESLQTGDGTVPLPGALPPFLPSTRLVCVQDDDLEFLELRDRLLAGVGGFHGLLPRMNLVQRLVTKHLCPAYRGRVWGRRLPGSRAWNPPISGLQERTY
jgi:pimeloyl-ACP methyl ester carboxylesterase